MITLNVRPIGISLLFRERKLLIYIALGITEVNIF